ncbi:MAG: RNA methyltransferase [Ignavibacteria bacterium]|nr:RNA methyltransferase [Ignavibacteria bacterium]
MTNKELKYYENLKRKKFRDSEGYFLIEGVHLIEECLYSKYYNEALKKLILEKGFSNNELLEKINSKIPNIETAYLEKNKFNKLTDTENPQGIIGVIKKTKPVAKEGNKKLLIALEKLNDPGNLGTIIRTCYWFDVDEVLISRNSVELYNSKVVRATQGALFNLIIREEQNLTNELKKLYSKGFEIYLADSEGKFELSEMNFKKSSNYVFVFGNEANGISEKLKQNKNFNTLRIKRNTNCESLNVGISVGIILNSFRN